MRVECSTDSITDAGVEISFRVHGFAMGLQVTQINMKRAPAKKFKVRPPEGFREEADPGYASLEEFQGDYLQDKPDASPEKIQKAWAAEQRRSKKENAREYVLIGRLKLKWFGSTRLFIPLDVNEAGTIDFVFRYSFLVGLLGWRATDAIGVEMTLPWQSR